MHFWPSRSAFQSWSQALKKICRLTSTDAVAAKRVPWILIFDDHPDSLRLVSGYRAKVGRDPSARPRANPRQPFVAGMLGIGALVGMLWPLF
jgi:hypothetical protein